MQMTPVAFVPYIASDGYDRWPIDAPTADDALEEAADSIRANCPVEARDAWSQKWDLAIYNEDGDLLMDKELIVHPDAGDCPGADEHSWGLISGPFGHGAGVTLTHKCRRCGLLQHEDTWHLNTADGTRYEAVKYEHDYRDDL